MNKTLEYRNSFEIFDIGHGEYLLHSDKGPYMEVSFLIHRHKKKKFEFMEDLVSEFAVCINNTWQTYVIIDDDKSKYVDIHSVLCNYDKRDESVV